MAGASRVDWRRCYNCEMRWSLASMFFATAFVAVASLAARYATTAGDLTGKLFAVAAIPLLLGAAIGTLAGRVGLGIRFGVAVDGGLIVLFSLWGIVH
jgi:hypothetical protein